MNSLMFNSGKKKKKNACEIIDVILAVGRYPQHSASVSVKVGDTTRQTE